MSSFLGFGSGKSNRGKLQSLSKLVLHDLPQSLQCTRIWPALQLSAEVTFLDSAFLS